MTRLIVNADDFGYTPGINRAIVELHGVGVLSSTTLMACGPAFDDAVTRAATESPAGSSRQLALGVGCHVVLVDGTPSALAASIPSLLEAEGSRDTQDRQEHLAPSPARFRRGLGQFIADLLRGRIREAEIECEAIAQIRSLQQAGIRVTHLDTHKHTHIFPGVLRPLLRAALQCGVRAMRNPFEPNWSVKATAAAPLLRRTQLRLLGHLRPGFLRLVREAGILTPEGSLGILATGSLDQATLEALLRAADTQARQDGDGLEPTWELVCHPGYQDQALAQSHTRLQAARKVEHAALLSLADGSKRLPLIHFGQLAL